MPIVGLRTVEQAQLAAAASRWSLDGAERQALDAAARTLAVGMPANPFASVTTVTVQIVQLLTGDQEFDSAKTLAAFALGLVLFIVTLLLNIVALSVVKRYREAYD